ncbi:MAG: hypothetical protein ETSY1_34680 [Candidatus Entotheonella factor]|uniref:Uncharacterized protein n=1 Tax=Entotheonella factor TaxID=1429438 RepID=W4LAY8_ENTF1|nr:hypothetical protein [Candidatus Entotheonella palauensis]ETW94481.1 MAG: hypothetical protein ETSY1_34680 [Candidatus Entotheonella factor]
MNEQFRRGTIIVDLDGTICEHRYPDFGPPLAGAREALQRFKESGYWIIIHSVRTSSVYRESEDYDPKVNSPEAVSEYLERHNIPFDEIWMHDKALGVAYIDDRGVRAVGDRNQSNWKEIADSLIQEPFRPRVW